MFNLHSREANRLGVKKQTLSKQKDYKQDLAFGSEILEGEEKKGRAEKILEEI